MKRSMTVTLVLSGSLLMGCSRRTDNDSSMSGSGTVTTNNTYEPSRGYYHSAYGTWHPYPHNYYQPGLGFYYGGIWSDAPDVKAVTPSVPARVSGSSSGGHSSSSGWISRGGFGFHGSSVS